MKMIGRFLAAAAVLLAASGGAIAQSGCASIVYGAVLTAGQWNACFAGKQDSLGYVPVNRAGDTMQGKLTFAASTTNNAAINVPQGAVPSSPNNGDVWTTTAGMFVRINGVTIGPLSGATASSFAGTSPITVSFPAGVVTYAFDFTVANTFLAQQTNQGATTTSPGWYTQITGDTVPRVRVGLNATDVPSIAFGPGNAVRDAFIERVGAGAIRFGAPDAASPVPQTISVQNVAAGTSNTAGATTTISGSQSTGTGIGGAIVVKIAPAGSTGSAQNPLLTALTLDASGTAGRATFASPVTMSAALTYGGVALANSVTGTGSMVLANSPALVTPALGAATGTSLALGGATIGGNALAVTGTSLFNSGVTMGAALTYGGVTLSNAVTGTGNMVLSASPTLSGTVAGNVTLSGNITHSGTALFTGAVASMTGNGQAAVGQTTALGGVFVGQGSTNDITIVNKSGTTVASVPTGTTTLNVVTLTLSNALSATYLPQATNAALGAMRGDGTTISCTAGVCTALGAAATSVAVGTTTVTSASGSNQLLTTGTVGAGTGTLSNISAAYGLTIGSTTIGVTLTEATASLGSDVATNNASLYFDGPSTNCGSACTTGVWLAAGQITMTNANAQTCNLKLWDGTSNISSSGNLAMAAGFVVTASLSGVFTGTVAGNIRISAKCTDTSGSIKFNSSGNSKDSTITVVRLQ